MFSYLYNYLFVPENNDLCTKEDIDRSVELINNDDVEIELADFKQIDMRKLCILSSDIPTQLTTTSIIKQIDTPHSIPYTLSIFTIPLSYYDIAKLLFSIANSDAASAVWIAYKVCILKDTNSLPFYILQLVSPSFAKPVLLAYYHLPDWMSTGIVQKCSTMVIKCIENDTVFKPIS